MGFFAVIADRPNAEFEVAECHINLWSLQGLLWRRIFLWDVGLRLKANAGDDVPKIQLALPFCTERRVQDLHDVILDPSTAQLVFGRAITIAGAKLDYGQGLVEVVRVPQATARLEEQWSGDVFSLWTLGLSPPVEPGSQAYLRIRFTAVSRCGRAWMWKRSWVAKSGAVVDLRIADMRQSVLSESWKALESRIVPIQRLNLFVIAPMTLRLHTVSPPLHYVRVLEGRPWEPYLGRVTDVRRSAKLAIYQWRPQSNQLPIDTTNPFRAFLDLSQEPTLRSPADIALLIFSITAASFVGAYVAFHVSDIVGNAKGAISLLDKVIGGISVLSIVTWVFRSWKPVRLALSTVHKGLVLFENVLYRARR